MKIAATSSSEAEIIAAVELADRIRPYQAICICILLFGI